MKAIDYAKMMCDTLMEEYNAEDLPYFKGRFHYIQGVLLLGMLRTYELCGDERYIKYIKDWVDSTIEEDGTVKIREELLDDMMPAMLLFRLYEKYGEEKYKKVIISTAEELKNWKRNELGGFWHKYKTPNQMWLDGLFMASPFLSEYADKFGEAELYDEVHRQAKIMFDNIRDEKTGLYYHAWDQSKEAEWADKETGLSEEFWGRAMGWVAVALCDILDYFPKNHEGRKDLEKQLAMLLESVVKYQDEKKGLWYQVVDKIDRADNWCETSCSALFAYALHKAARLGYVGAEFSEYAMKAYNGIMAIVKTENNRLIIPEICVGTNVSDYEQYISRPRVDNDSHGTGTFMLMCSEFAAN